MDKKFISEKAYECSFFSASRMPICLEDIFANLGISVCDTRDLNKDGYFIRDNDIKLVFVNRKILNRGKRRFVLSHELGHFFLHPQIMVQSCNNVNESFNRNSDLKDMESEANYFASELLSPQNMVKKRIGKSTITFDMITDIAKEFEVSVTSMAIKCVENSISESELLICYEDNRLRWFTSANPDWTYEMIPEIGPDESLVYQALGKSILEVRQRKSRDVWEMFSGIVTEQIFPISRSTILVLLTGIQKEYM